MKKKIMNDKVIRAMAIGISAMLATATPMSVMAADGVDDTEGGNPNEAEQTTNPTSNVCDDAQDAADAAQDVNAGTQYVNAGTQDVNAGTQDVNAGT